MRPTAFVLLTKSRSGSKWLVELLDSHPQLAVYGELFGGTQVRNDYGAPGVRYATALWSTFAYTDDVPREAVLENVDEARGALAGTRFEWMLARAVRALATA